MVKYRRTGVGVGWLMSKKKRVMHRHIAHTGALTFPCNEGSGKSDRREGEKNCKKTDNMLLDL
jgi:hypothetical protein